MDFKTRKKGDSYIIEVETSEKVAVVVRSDSGERIYLPGEGGSDSTYYNEDPDYMNQKSGRWTVRHHEEPQEVQVVS